MELVRKTKASAGVKLNINRVALTVGAQLVRSSLLEPDSGISAAERAILEQWEIGHNWAKDFVSRHKLKSVVLHGTGGGRRVLACPACGNRGHQEGVRPGHRGHPVCVVWKENRLSLARVGH
jgi:hypothetical protein